jgi:SAM-dependent methyltransferase
MEKVMTRYDPQWVRQFYAEYGEKEWDRHEKTPTEEVKLHVHRHYLAKHISSGDRVLEIGPGPGRFTQMLAELGAKIVVADISPVQLDLNREYAKKLGFASAVEEWLELDVCEMGIVADGGFDAVVCYGGPLSYVFEQRDEAISEILRVTRPDGVVLLGVMSLWGTTHEFLPGVMDVSEDENWEIIGSGDLCPDTLSQSTHNCHMFRADELRRFLEEAGVEILEMSASNCLSAAWGDRLEEVRNDTAKWKHLLEMEVEACREPGCLDMSTHLIAVIKKTAK